MVLTVYLPPEIDEGFVFVRLAEDERTSRISGKRWIRPPWAYRRSRRVVVNTLGNPELSPTLRSQEFWRSQQIIDLKLYFVTLKVAQSWRFLNNFQWLGFSVGFQPESWLSYEFCGPGPLQVRVPFDDYGVRPLLNDFLRELSLKLLLIVFEALLLFALPLLRLLPLHDLFGKGVIGCALIELVVNVVDEAAHDYSRLRFYSGGVDLRLPLILFSVEK